MVSDLGRLMGHEGVPIDRGEAPVTCVGCGDEFLPWKRHADDQLGRPRRPEMQWCKGCVRRLAAAVPDAQVAMGDWVLDAACRPHDDTPPADVAALKAVFFPEVGEATTEAKAICARCRVRNACLAYALEANETRGVWGGKTPEQRRNIRRALQRKRAQMTERSDQDDRATGTD